MAKLMRTKQSIYGLTDDLNTLTSDLATETSRATASETSISSALASEVSRAQGAETSIAGDLASEVSRATASETSISSALSAEASRAVIAEGSISASLASEVSRATASETSIAGDLASEVSRATASETSISSALASEVSRAQGAETSIAGDLASEVSRATASEGSISASLASEVSRATSAETSIASGLASEISRATTAEQSLQAEIDATGTRISALGNVFNYVGTVTAGADASSAFDMATLPSDGKNAGDYYKVTTAGYVKDGTSQAAFYVNIGDGLVFNLVGTLDIIDNTNSQVFGSTNFIAVTGSADTGFTVDVDSNFKGRVSTLESGLISETSRAQGAETSISSALASEVSRATASEGSISASLASEVSRAQGAETSISSALASEVSRATASETSISSALSAEISRATSAETSIAGDLASEVSRATAAESSLNSAKMDKSANLSDVVDVPTARTNLDVYSKEEVNTAIANQSNITKNLSGVIANDKITFTDAPLNGTDGVAFGVCRVYGVIASAPSVVDDVELTLDTTDASGKTFIVNADVSGEYNGLTAKVFALVRA